MIIERFEEIEAWKKARELTKKVYLMTSTYKFKRDFGLRDQTQRAAVSVMANIAEGFDTETPLDFIRFLTYSRRSATEIQSHLYVAFDNEYINSEDFGSIFRNTVETKNLIYGFIRYLRRKIKLQKPKTYNLEPGT